MGVHQPAGVAGPACPDRHVCMSDGTRAAQHKKSNAQRYTYVCRACGRWFDQLRPNLLRAGEDRQARWRPDLAPNVHTQPDHAASPATQTIRQRVGRRHTPRKWELRRGQHHGEVSFGFHNSRGQLSDAVARRNYIERLMERFDIVGVCELNDDAIMRGEMERAESAR